MTTSARLDSELHFPDSDGQPLADNTEQYRWIVLIKENLEVLFANAPHVFVAGDLLWYPAPSRLVAPTAPDVMVILGRPKGKRGSYRQWQEENIAPQVVFEILSPSNKAEEMERKLEFYDTYGVQEYYLYDPETFQLDGWIRQSQHLTKIWQMAGWVSPQLKIRFEVTQGEPILYTPDGQRFLSTVEMNERMKLTEQTLQQERQRAEKLAAYLRSQGINPDSLP
jgi:Uma2 family endonuclease